MPKVAQKKNLSSIQVLKTLKVLLQGNYTMNELLDILNRNEADSGMVFNNSVVSKYINTCRFCHIEIPKINNKYIVTYLPFGLEFSNDESDLISKLQIIVKENMSKRACQILNELINKLNRFSNKKIVRVEKEEYIYSVELFERAVMQRRKVKLLFKNRSELICTPLQVVVTENKKFFKVFKNRERLIDVARLSGVESLNDKFIPGNMMAEQTVVFVLKGDLAKRYTLRDNESMISQNIDGSITVSNRGESKDALLSRLLRYEDKCELLNPKSYREEMKQILQDTLKNYGVM